MKRKRFPLTHKERGATKRYIEAMTIEDKQLLNDYRLAWRVYFRVKQRLENVLIDNEENFDYYYAGYNFLTSLEER